MTKRERIDIETTEGTVVFRCPKLSQFEAFVEAMDEMDRKHDLESIRAIRGILEGWLLSGSIDLEPWEFNHVRNRLYVECLVPPEKKSS